MNQRSQTQKILTHLSGGIGGLAGGHSSVKKPFSKERDDFSKGVLVTFAANPQPMKQTLETLRSWKKTGCSFDIAFSANAEALTNTTEILKLLQPIRQVSRNIQALKDYRIEDLSAIVALNMTHNSASKLSQGIQDGLIPILLWHGLWKGIPVYMDFSALRTYHGEPTANPALRHMTEASIHQLKTMGVMDLNTDQQPQNNGFTSTQKPLNSKVWTEKDVLAMPSGSTVEVGKGTILTALAREAAKAKSITLQHLK